MFCFAEVDLCWSSSSSILKLAGVVQDMGFMDQQANILALQINHGDVSAAVAYLIERGAH